MWLAFTASLGISLGLDVLEVMSKYSAKISDSVMMSPQLQGKPRHIAKQPKFVKYSRYINIECIYSSSRIFARMISEVTNSDRRIMQSQWQDQLVTQTFSNHNACVLALACFDLGQKGNEHFVMPVMLRGSLVCLPVGPNGSPPRQEEEKRARKLILDQYIAKKIQNKSKT